MTHPDEALIARICRSDEDALSELYDRYHRMIFGIALNTVGNRELAEEITLDVFTRVWEKAHTYDPSLAKVSTWMTRMTRNRSIDVLRREGVRPEGHSVGWAESGLERQAGDHRTEQDALLALQKRQVREAVAALPEEQRQVLALAYFRGYSHTEIAKALDHPLGTVKGRIRTAMRRLRDMLGDLSVESASDSVRDAYDSTEESVKP